MFLIGVELSELEDGGAGVWSTRSLSLFPWR